MAARINPTLTESWKKKIKIASIINRLGLHIDGKLELSTTQIAAAKILLGKTIPDVTYTESKNENSHTIKLNPETISDFRDELKRIAKKL